MQATEMSTGRWMDKEAVVHIYNGIFSSVQFSCSVVSDSLRPHESQYARLPCPSLSPWVCSNSCPLSQWCHPTISSSFPSSPLALNLSQHQGLFQWVSSLHHKAKVLISFRSDWFDLLAVQGTLKILLQHHSLKVSFFGVQPSLWSNSHIHTWHLENP